MAKKKRKGSIIVLIALLLIVPVAVLMGMGFGNYDANEFLILSVAVCADIAIYVVYTLVYPRLKIISKP